MCFHIVFMFSSFKFYVRIDTDEFKNTIGTITIKILNTKYKNFTITTRYRPPKANFEILKD